MFVKGIKFLYQQNKLIVALCDTTIDIHFPLMLFKVTSWDLNLDLFPCLLCLQTSLLP